MVTKIYVKSLTINEDNEFFIFMELCQELQWASFMMNPHKWVAATQAYNT